MISADRWRPADGLRLEPNALRAATEINRTLALTAGPGAGKSELLAQRADFLFRCGLCRYPRRILAISFKVDASQNLKARVRKRCGAELASRLDSHTFHAFAKRIIDKFRPVLIGRDRLNRDYTIGSQRIQYEQITFADMVPLAVHILQTSNIARNSIQQTYSHIFLDEFQDCTEPQYELIKAAFQNTDAGLTAVGDTKQRIMGWAGALEGIFEKFASDFNAEPLNLYQNFRSEMRLRRMQNEMVKVMDAKAAVDDDELLGSDGIVEVLRFADSHEEAEAIAKLVESWIDEEDLDPSDIAVLVSKQLELYCNHLQAAFAIHGIPFRNEENTQELSAEPIASLIIDFLLVIIGAREPSAYGRLIDLVMFDANGTDAEYERRARWDRFIDASRKRVVPVDTDALRQLVGDMLDMLGRDAVIALSADYERGTRLDDLIEATFARVEQLFSEEQEPLRALARFSGDRAVKIMTIHKSKGLEFDSVIILGVENETFWGKLHEERAAFFVAISRAKRRLVLTASEHRQAPEGAKYWKENRTEHEEFIGYAEGVMK